MMMVRKLFIAAAITLLPTVASADTVLRYSITTAGGIATTGNTLGLSKALDANGPGTEDSIGTFITLQPATVDNLPSNPANPWFSDTTFDWTLNGSEAELVLPKYAEVLYAELVWGGSWAYGSENVLDNLEDSVVLGTDGDSIAVAPDPGTALTFAETSIEGFAINYYLRSADVTDFVETHLDGFYATEGVPATQDSLIDELNAAGWSLMVVYRNSEEPIRNLTVFVGGEFVDEDSVVDYEVDGFCTPPSGNFSGYASISALEGDADREGDFLTVSDTLAGPFVPLVGPNNPENNFFCSQINDVDGDLDTSGSFGTFNHDPFGAINLIAGRQGWDITTVPVSSMDGHLVAGQTSAILRTETVGDSYLPTAAGFAIEVNAPDFAGATSAIAPGLLGDDQVATATISLANVGLVSADSVVFFAPLPAGLSLDSFSIDGVDGDVDGNPVTSADMTSGVALGDIDLGQAREIVFEVRVTGEPDNGTGWQINPQWTYDYISCVGQDPLTEPHSTNPLQIDYDIPEGDGDTGGLDDSGGDDSASAEQGGEDDDASAGGTDDSDDSDTEDAGADGTGIASATGGAGDGRDGGCGCTTTQPATPAWALTLLALISLRRRRKASR